MQIFFNKNLKYRYKINNEVGFRRGKLSFQIICFFYFWYKQ